MTDLQLGRLLRLRRMRRGVRLREVADRSGLSVATVARGESGSFASVAVVRRHAAALDLRVEWLAIGRGADVARTLDEEHAAIVEAAAQWLRASGCEVAAEAGFSVYGERGRVDVLAFDAASGALFLVEVKTELADLQATLGAIDVRERLAARIAAERGWSFAHRCSVLAVADVPSNRKIVRAHRATFADWTRGTFRRAAHPAVVARQLLWVPAGSAGRERWLAGRRRVARA